MFQKIFFSELLNGNSMQKLQNKQKEYKIDHKMIKKIR